MIEIKVLLSFGGGGKMNDYYFYFNHIINKKLEKIFFYLY